MAQRDIPCQNHPIIFTIKNAIIALGDLVLAGDDHTALGFDTAQRGAAGIGRARFNRLLVLIGALVINGHMGRFHRGLALDDHNIARIDRALLLIEDLQLIGIDRDRRFRRADAEDATIIGATGLACLLCWPVRLLRDRGACHGDGYTDGDATHPRSAPHGFVPCSCGACCEKIVRTRPRKIISCPPSAISIPFA